MKRISFTLLMVIGFLAAYSQMTNGGIVNIETGATLVIEGNYTSTGAGLIDVDGEVVLKGNFINNNSSGSGIDASSFGHIKFNGTSAQEITGSQPTTFYCGVVVDKASGGVALTATAAPGANQVLDSTLVLTNGKVTLNGFDLTLSNEGVTGASSSNYIVTNSTGKLKAPVTNANYLFPVGSATNYNPLVLKEDGTADTYGVTYAAATPTNWSPADHAVVGSWTVTEDNGTGNNLTVTPGWNATDEQGNFDSGDCAVGVTTDDGTTIAWKASGAAAGPDGNGTYSKSGAGFATVGKFVVGDYFYEGIDLDLDMFLAGAYNSGSMTTALNSVIPSTDPYGNGITGASVPGSAVDWVEVELRDETTPGTVVESYSFFVDNNGNVLNLGGTIGAKLTGVAKDQYYVAVRHRNHLGARTLNTIDFTSGSSFSFDYTAGTGVFGSNPMRNMGGGIYALWAGDTDGDGVIRFGASPSDLTPVNSGVMSDPDNLGNSTLFVGDLGYYDADADMNGYIMFGASPSDMTPVNSSVMQNPGNSGNSTLYTVSEQMQ